MIEIISKQKDDMIIHRADNDVSELNHCYVYPTDITVTPVIMPDHGIKLYIAGGTAGTEYEIRLSCVLMNDMITNDTIICKVHK